MMPASRLSRLSSHTTDNSAAVMTAARRYSDRNQLPGVSRVLNHHATPITSAATGLTNSRSVPTRSSGRRRKTSRPAIQTSHNSATRTSR